jgi:hypothetical protein
LTLNRHACCNELRTGAAAGIASRVAAFEAEQERATRMEAEED